MMPEPRADKSLLSRAEKLFLIGEIRRCERNAIAARESVGKAIHRANMAGISYGDMENALGLTRQQYWKKHQAFLKRKLEKDTR